MKHQGYSSHQNQVCSSPEYIGENEHLWRTKVYEKNCRNALSLVRHSSHTQVSMLFRGSQRCCGVRRTVAFTSKSNSLDIISLQFVYTSLCECFQEYIGIIGLSSPNNFKRISYMQSPYENSLTPTASIELRDISTGYH